MTDMYEALEICLKEIENGAAMESVLLRFPEFADELRPILDASLDARSLSAPEPSAEIVKRNRAKVLQRASELREADVRPRMRFRWSAPVLRLASTLVLVFLIFISGTSLVGAASTSLPGDNLYPVKRSWERLQLAFTFNAETRNSLEVDHENERIEELLELFNVKRSAEVEFNGTVTSQNGNEWLVAGIKVVISPETELSSGQVPLNAPVKVEGSTQPDGSVIASSIELLAPGTSLPDVEEAEDQRQNQGDDSGSNDAPSVAATQIPDSDEVQFEGVLNVRNGDFWTINGVPSDVSTAEIEGTPALGAAVTVEGYFDSKGTFIVTKIKFEEKKPDGGLNSNNNNNDNSNSDDNSNDDDSGDDNSGSEGGDD